MGPPAVVALLDRFGRGCQGPGELPVAMVNHLTWAGPCWIRPTMTRAGPGPSGQALQGLCEQGPRPAEASR